MRLKLVRKDGVEFMLRLDHALSEVCLLATSLSRKLASITSRLFVGYTMAARLRARALRKPEFNTGNCLTYVFTQRLRHGGRVVLIKSLYGWWCHAYWLSATGEVFEYAPVQPHRTVKKLWHPLPPLVYQGRERLAPKLPQSAVRKIYAIMQPRKVELQPAPAIITARAAPMDIQAMAA
ncbi:MAG: hypothetical protein AAF221_08445 [Pseudomonadota bacterium]